MTFVAPFGADQGGGGGVYIRSVITLLRAFSESGLVASISSEDAASINAHKIAPNKRVRCDIAF